MSAPATMTEVVAEVSSESLFEKLIYGLDFNKFKMFTNPATPDKLVVVVRLKEEGDRASKVMVCSTGIEVVTTSSRIVKIPLTANVVLSEKTAKCRTWEEYLSVHVSFSTA